MNISNTKDEFKKRVFEIVRKIPKGRTMTYKEVAALVGRTRAWRVVGNVLSENYDPAIPCHRVIRSDGKMGGYNRGGIAKKLSILKQEARL